MISVIVPVYNAQKTIKRCIRSVLNQSYHNTQVIVIIDGVGGNQDVCLDIVNDFYTKDQRVQIIVQQENAGVDRARFAGLNAAIGEYVTFVDADDWLESDSLSMMISIMDQNCYDYIQVSSYKCIGPIKRRRNLPFCGSITVPDLFDKYYMSFFGLNLLPVSIWGKLYRRETIEKAVLSPSGFAMGEDLIFNMCLFPYLKQIYLLNKPYYNYRYGGMTSRYNPYLLKDLKSQFLLKLKAIEQYSYYKANNSARIEMINVFHSDIYQRILYHKEKTQESIVQGIFEEITDAFWGEVLNLTSDYMDSSPFYYAMKNHDAEALYDICKKEVDSSRIQRTGKIIASRLLELI